MTTSQESAATPPARKHRATYATDRRLGGYLVRVVGPDCEKFVGREVPVTTKANTEHQEKLTRLVWTGKDKETGDKVALYKFEPKPKEATEDIPF